MALKVDSKPENGCELQESVRDLQKQDEYRKLCVKLDSINQIDKLNQQQASYRAAPGLLTLVTSIADNPE